MASYNIDDYVAVNERIEKFYEKYPQGSIETEIAYNDNGQVIFKAYAYRDREDNRPATGHAMEKEGSSFINKTSHIENCETSAVGRALAMLGFEIKKSIASKEEVENAQLQQDIADIEKTQEKVISKTQEEALDKAIKNRKISDEKVEEILEKYGYSSTSEIKMKDYAKIVNDFQKLVKQE